MQVFSQEFFYFVANFLGLTIVENLQSVSLQSRAVQGVFSVAELLPIENKDQVLTDDFGSERDEFIILRRQCGDAEVEIFWKQGFVQSRVRKPEGTILLPVTGIPNKKIDISHLPDFKNYLQNCAVSLHRDSMTVRPRLLGGVGSLSLSIKRQPLKNILLGVAGGMGVNQIEIYKREMEWRFKQFEELFEDNIRRDNLEEIDTIWNEYLFLIKSEDSKEWIFIRAVENLIYTLRRTPCNERTANDILNVFNKLTTEVSNCIKKDVSDLKMERVTRGLATALQNVVLCYYADLIKTFTKEKKDNIYKTVDAIRKEYGEQLNIAYNLELVVEGVKWLRNKLPKNLKKEAEKELSTKVKQKLINAGTITAGMSASAPILAGIPVVGATVALGKLYEAFRTRSIGNKNISEHPDFREVQSWYVYALFLIMLSKSVMNDSDIATFNAIWSHNVDQEKERAAQSWQWHCATIEFLGDVLKSSKYANSDIVLPYFSTILHGDYEPYCEKESGKESSIEKNNHIRAKLLQIFSILESKGLFSETQPQITRNLSLVKKNFDLLKQNFPKLLNTVKDQPTITPLHTTNDQMPKTCNFRNLNQSFIGIESFIGRKDELAKIKQKLTEEDEKKSVVLYGMVGVGKTQLAYKFIEEN